MGSGFLKKKKEMKKLQSQFEQMKSNVNCLEVVGESGHGLVSLTLTGEYRMKEIKIKPDCIDPKDADGLQDLIRVAYNDAINKLEIKTNNMSGIPNPMSGGFPF